MWNSIQQAEKQAEGGTAPAHRTDLLIAADSIVVTQNGDILEKAETREDARRMMRTLSGSSHSVITGLVLFVRTSDNSDDEKVCYVLEHAETTKVTFEIITDEEMELYLDSDLWKGKAGAYGIQDLASVFIPKIEGDFYTVMGFPLCAFNKLVKQLMADKRFAKLQQHVVEVENEKKKADDSAESKE